MSDETSESEALAVYGSLAPGEPNHWVIARIKGAWTPGTVQGYAFEITWGPAEGYQGFIPDVDGTAVPVHVLHSEQLTKKWREIDDFEGDGYRREMIKVTTDDGIVNAQIYVALTDIE